MIKYGTRTRDFSSITPVSVTRWKKNTQRLFRKNISGSGEHWRRIWRLSDVNGGEQFYLARMRRGSFYPAGSPGGTIERVTDNYSDGKRGRKELLYRYTKTFRGSKVHDLGIFRSTTKWYSTQLVSNFKMLTICWKLHEYTNKSIQKILCFQNLATVKNFIEIC